MHTFKAKLDIIGINPFVFVPEKILAAIFKAAGKDKGPIRVYGTVNKVSYEQTLVRYGGAWRLYINTNMLKDSPKRVGETVSISIAFNVKKKETAVMHPKLRAALKKHASAKKIFDTLTSSRQQEIIRYIANLKTEASVENNVSRAIEFLLGNTRFMGRDKP